MSRYLAEHGESTEGDLFWVWFELGGRGWCIARQDEAHFAGAKLVRLELVDRQEDAAVRANV